jgi:glucose-1-phosphate thymidylyltransferase
MKGVLICGGTGSRLRPLTEIANKSLLPVYDRPLICYPLDTLRSAGIEDIAVVTGTEHMDQMAAFLGSGAKFGCEFSYKVQEKPGGIAQALGLAEEFADGEPVCAILGDNIYFDNISSVIRGFPENGGGHVFVRHVHDPERFGIAEMNGDRILSIEEKPAKPKSDLAITGCYVYDNRCFDVIRGLQPSARGELEITDVSKWYLEQGVLSATVLQEPWVDAGTFESLFEAARLVREKKQK